MSNAVRPLSDAALSRRGLLTLAGASILPLGLAACGNQGANAQYPSDVIRIMAPAAPAGGWDVTARSLMEVLNASGLAEDVEVYNVEGAAGTVGLAQFVGKANGNPYELMVTGLVMVGGVITGGQSVAISDTTPIACLTSEPEVLAVPTDSKYETLDDLISDAKSNPADITWGGGSAGGTDEILVLRLAEVAGADPTKMKYQAASGGGESKDGLLNGDLDVGVSGPSEYVDLFKDGKLRALAVSGAEAVDVGTGEETPTIKDSGYDLEMLNWRGIVAPGGIDEDMIDQIVGLFEKLVESEEWKEELEKQGWDDMFMGGQEAADFFNEESARVQEIFEEVGRT